MFPIKLHFWAPLDELIAATDTALAEGGAVIEHVCWQAGWSAVYEIGSGGEFAGSISLFGSTLGRDTRATWSVRLEDGVGPGRVRVLPGPIAELRQVRLADVDPVVNVIAGLSLKGSPMFFEIPLDFESTEGQVLAALSAWQTAAGYTLERPAPGGRSEFQLSSAGGPWGSVSLQKMGSKTHVIFREPKDGGERWAAYLGVILRHLQAAGVPIGREYLQHLGEAKGRKTGKRKRPDQFQEEKVRREKQIVSESYDLVKSGLSMTEADGMIKQKHGIPPRTMRSWRAKHKPK